MIALPALFAQAPGISPERIRAHDRFLSSDLLEGRGVGQRGGDLATEYIATQFEPAGAKPAVDNGACFQKVPLAGIEPPGRLSMGQKLVEAVPLCVLCPLSALRG